MTENNLKRWRCTVCGYIHTGEAPPETCPICGASAAEFEVYEEPPKTTGPKLDEWRCMNCSYVHQGQKAPDFCPVCGVRSDRFTPVEKMQKKEVEREDISNIVIIGGGIAGVSAAESMRESSKKIDITLISKEPDLPYYRLNLTRFLAGEIEEESLPIHSEAWYNENNIELRLGQKVERLFSDANKLQLLSGEKITYAKLIVTMGSHAFIPPFEGTKLDGVHTLRTYQDTIKIIDGIKNVNSVLCIGGGILGLETAGALAKRGVNVTLLEVYDWLMPRQLNQRAGELLLERLENMGINVVLAAKTEEILGNNRLTGIRLQDGTKLDTELAIITAGVRANSYLARSAGLHVRNGIIVDDYLRTSASDVYAAGDIAEHGGVLYGSWSASQYQGSIAGLNALGIPTVFGGIPRSNTLKVLGIDLMSIGKFEPEDGSYFIIEGEIEQDYYRFVFRDGCLVGCVLMGNAEIGPKVKKIVEAKSDCSKIIKNNYTVNDVLSFIDD